MNEYIQPFITLASSAAILLVLRQQIKSQQEQINTMKSSVESMKAYMDIFKIDDIKKYVDLKQENAVMQGQLAAEKVLKETLQSTEWAKNLFKPFEDKTERSLESDLFLRGQELFDNTITHLAHLPKEEMFKYVNQHYPLNRAAILKEYEEVEKVDPDFLAGRRQSFRESMGENPLKGEE